MSNIAINFDDLTNFEAPLKTLQENLLRAANDYFINHTSTAFSAVEPHLYNRVGLLRVEAAAADFFDKNVFFDQKIITNSSARNNFTGIGTTVAALNPTAYFSKTKIYEDWCFYVEFKPLTEFSWNSSAIGKNPPLYDNTERISTNFRYRVPTHNPNYSTSTPEKNMGLDYWGVIEHTGSAPTPTHNYDGWLYVSRFELYTRAHGTTSDRILVITPTASKAVMPVVLWDIQNLFYYVKTGSKPRAQQYNGALQGLTMFYPRTAFAFASMYNWRLLETHTMTDAAENDTILIDAEYKHQSTLGENIKILAPETEQGYYEWARTETTAIFRSRDGVDKAILAFKSPDDFFNLAADWGITRITDDLTDAKQKPEDLFDGYEPNGDSFVPDGGSSSGTDTNGTIPSIPSFSDNTSDKITPDTPNISAINAASVYALSLTGVKSLLRWLMTDDFTKNISELFSDKLSAIDDLKIMPFDVVNHDTLHTVYSETLTVANVTGNVACYKIQPNYNCIIQGGSYHYTAYWGDYNDYTSASYFLYIPYGGVVELSPSFVVNCDLRIEYALDIMTGNATAIIYSNNVFVKTVPCQMGQTVPLTYTNTNQREIKNTLAALNAGTTLINMAAGKTDILGGVLNIGNTIARTALTNPLTIGSIGNFGANTSLVMPQNPFLIISRVQQSIPADMNGIIGRPSNTHNTISTFVGSGFVQISADHINTTATTAEQEQIINLLQNGIYL